MSKIILLVHGRSFKPPKADLKRLWVAALRHGIERDRPEKLKAYDDAQVEFVYYGHISNPFLEGRGYKPPGNDLADRQRALDELKQYTRWHFRKTTYEKLPRFNPWMELLADVFATPADLFGLSEPIITRVAPDMAEYWDDRLFGSEIRSVFTDALIAAMKKKADICVVGHSLGTLINYDTFWKLSHYSEYRDETWNRAVDLWITLGSPLANPTVRRNLKGAREAEAYRYPTNVARWLNIAAEDDYIAHDETVADNFRRMRSHETVQSIRDDRIYNLAVRIGSDGRPKSNPHHGVGYLIHPAVADAMADWL